MTSAYQAMFNQNERFRTALMSTRGMRLYHSKGESNPYKTILTENELYSILMNIRADYDKREKILHKPQSVDSEKSYVIPVAIAETTLNLKVTASTEEYYRRDAKTVNDNIKKYQQSCSDASIEQILGAITIENIYKNNINNWKNE